MSFIEPTARKALLLQKAGEIEASLKEEYSAKLLQAKKMKDMDTLKTLKRKMHAEIESAIENLSEDEYLTGQADKLW